MKLKHRPLDLFCLAFLSFSVARKEKRKTSVKYIVWQLMCTNLFIVTEILTNCDNPTNAAATLLSWKVYCTNTCVEKRLSYKHTECKNTI